jgi:hypothetical protein
MDTRYMAKELWYRKRRTLTATIGLAVGMAILITMNALSAAYSEAARMPLKEIGADITVQRAGDVPETSPGLFLRVQRSPFGKMRSIKFEV